MPCSNTIDEAISLAQARWPGFEFRVKSSEEACGPCPVCGGATKDGFLIFATGYYFCRPGNHSGWLDENQRIQLTPEQKALRKVIAEQERAKREREDIKRRLSALERLNRTDEHILYNQALDETDRDWWHSQGINDESIAKHQLGVCFQCPMDYPDHRPSYTIPIYDSKHKTLLNIRHRLIGPIDGDRYRPHMKGLPGKVLFNSVYAVSEKEVLLCEGEKKAIVLEQNGYPAMGALGKSGFNLAWLKKFNARTITLCPDPDALASWRRLADQIAKEGFGVYLCALPAKPDDLFVNGCSVDRFDKFLRLSRKVA